MAISLSRLPHRQIPVPGLMRQVTALGLMGMMFVAAAAGRPARGAEVLDLRGRGVQIYDCATSPGGFAWKLKAPEATLLTSTELAAGHHFAGPSWQAVDGSIVVGEVVASAMAPATDGAIDAIPWLVLRAKSHMGKGEFAAVTYVTRTRTKGGLAPSGGCDASRAGSQTRVPYSATYTFFGAK